MIQAGDDWAVIDQETVNLALQPGMTNTVIWPETGKSQEYHHLTKVHNKHKFINVASKEIVRLFQGLGDTKGTNTFFKSTETKSHKEPRSHTVALSVI